MNWKGLYPILSLSKTVYQKGISLTKKAMKQVESRLQRNPVLPKWDILIQPLLLVIYFSTITFSKYLAQVSTGLRSSGVSLGKVLLRPIPGATELDLPSRISCKRLLSQASACVEV